MRRCHDRDQRHVEQELAVHGFRKHRQRTDDADLAGPLQHRLDDRAEHLNEQPQRSVRKFVTKLSNRIDQLPHGIHHIDREREFRFKPFAQGLRSGFEAIHLIGDGTCLLQQRAPIIRERGIACAAIEQCHAKLPFEIRQGLADDGLRTSKLAARGGKAALLGGGDEGAKLIQGYTVEHGPSPKPMDNIE